eukprot:1193556-Prorocentrum_minimum.AAC.8
MMRRYSKAKAVASDPASGAPANFKGENNETAQGKETTTLDRIKTRNKNNETAQGQETTTLDQIKTRNKNNETAKETTTLYRIKIRNKNNETAQGKETTTLYRIKIRNKNNETAQGKETTTLYRIKIRNKNNNETAQGKETSGVHETQGESSDEAIRRSTDCRPRHDVLRARIREARGGHGQGAGRGERAHCRVDRGEGGDADGGPPHGGGARRHRRPAANRGAAEGAGEGNALATKRRPKALPRSPDRTLPSYEQGRREARVCLAACSNRSFTRVSARDSQIDRWVGLPFGTVAIRARMISACCYPRRTTD